jgi:hypothetical protein
MLNREMTTYSEPRVAEIMAETGMGMMQAVNQARAERQMRNRLHANPRHNDHRFG